MKEEIIKHSQKIYNTVKNSEHSLGNKLKEISIEILIIVFAVSLSIWLHDWNEYKHEQSEIKSFLNNLKKDLKKDIENFKTVKSQYQNVIKSYEHIINMTPRQLDSLNKNDRGVNITIFTAGRKTYNSDYDSFKSSGKIGNIKNERLRQLIVEYYELSIPNINEQDKIYSEFVFKLIEFKIEFAGQKDKISYSNPQLIERLKIATLLKKSIIENYESIGISKAQQIIREIDKTLRK